MDKPSTATLPLPERLIEYHHGKGRLNEILLRKTSLIVTVLSLVISAAGLTAAPGEASAADKTTKYRVYQDNKTLTETADYRSAEAYAKRYPNSHVEEIGTRKWLWDNYPRYKVFQYGYSTSAWEFATLNQAIAEASRWGHASIRDLQSGGWVWNNYPRYRVYQGETTLKHWEFTTLEQAKAEAVRWANSHIIDLNTHAWVWDNISAERKKQIRESNAVTYLVYQGEYTDSAWKFALLEDAVKESLRWSNSVVIRTDNAKVIFDNMKQYEVYQNDKYLTSFLGLDQAVDYAKKYAHTKIIDMTAPAKQHSDIWNNYPYYQVFQSERQIGEYSTIKDALNYAMKYSNASIRRLEDGTIIWDNVRKLQFWGWNGSSSDSTIRSHAANTMGLDVISPTYFELKDASGNLTDNSNAATVAWLKQQGYTVYPLVHNQFDSALTTKFLADANARSKFINALITKLVQIGANGINLDFESISGKDRAAYTQFVRELTVAAHAKGLIVSIDLPRGSVRWNAQTAYDHEKLAGIVDYIITMTYDQHYKGSPEPGSVSGLQWTEEGIKEFLAYGIPRDKLIMGIPFYVREWQIDASGKLISNRALLMKDLSAHIAAKGAKLTWDSSFNQYKAEYTEGGYTYVFWVENEESVKARLELAAKYELAGVAAWRLGYDSAALWQTMIQHK